MNWGAFSRIDGSRPTADAQAQQRDSEERLLLLVDTARSSAEGSRNFQLIPHSRLSVSFTALSDWIVARRHGRVARQVPEVRCPDPISIQRNGFQSICCNAVGCVHDWHTNCFEEIRKEKPMKTKTNVKAGAGKGNVAGGWGVVQNHPA
jgi:hypothetical protein